MLARFQAYLNCHLVAASNSFQSLAVKPMASILTITVIAISLTLPALFWVFTDNLHSMMQSWQQGGSITLYLKSSLSAQEELDFLQQVQNHPGVKSAQIKTKEAGLSELKQQEGMHDIMQYLASNPLPTLINVTANSSFSQPEALQSLYQQLKNLSAVEQSRLDAKWVERLYVIMGFISKLTQTLMVLLSLAVVLIIGNTLRSAVQNRRAEIEILKLIGAPDTFISRPFLYTGIWYGLLGAIFAIFLINIFMLSAALALEKLALLYHMQYPLSGLTIKQAYSILLAALVLSWLGANITVRKQLYSIEPVI